MLSLTIIAAGFAWSDGLAFPATSRVNVPTKTPHNNNVFSRRSLLLVASSPALLTVSPLLVPLTAWALEEESLAEEDPSVSVVAATTTTTTTGEAKKLFNQGRALEQQGNMAAAQRLYQKVTQMSPRFVYGWSNLGNTQTAMGDLPAAEESYTVSIDLCGTLLLADGSAQCPDLYLLLLNRGSLRLNNGRPRDALQDLLQAAALRGRPDALVLQNLARAKELNGLYQSADSDYAVAISMTANEVNPFWLRAAMVKYQLGDVKGGLDLLKRVRNRFPDVPEVQAAYATFLFAEGQEDAARQTFLGIPDRQRLKYSGSSGNNNNSSSSSREYLTQKVAWPPRMIEMLGQVAAAVGDVAR